MICTAHIVSVREDGLSGIYISYRREVTAARSTLWMGCGRPQAAGRAADKDSHASFLYPQPHTSNQSSHQSGSQCGRSTMTMDAMIILKGAGSRGKSSTLHQLIKQLDAQPHSEIIYSEHHPDETADWFVIINTIGQRIGVITQGDPGSESYVTDCLTKCVEEKCDAIVAASRTRYNHDNPTVYSLLWDFGRDYDMRIVETTPYVTFDNWGKTVERDMLHRQRATDIVSLLEAMHKF